MAHPRRPDKSRGVFETLLILGGLPVDLDPHLSRLHQSLTTLYPDRRLPDVPGVMGPYATSTPGASGRGALRVVVRPDGPGGFEVTVEEREAARGGVVELHSFTLPGGLGEHKWVDRSLIEGAEAELPEGALPLICDEDGTVLEASRANLFAVRDGALFTPPLDGRILPGITRRRVIERAVAAGVEVREVPLDADDLLAADEVFVTGSVRGVEPVRALDGEPLGAGTPALFG